MVQDTLVKEF